MKLQPKTPSLTMICLELEKMQSNMQFHKDREIILWNIVRTYEHHLEILKDYNQKDAYRIYQTWLTDFGTKYLNFRKDIEGNTIHKK
jgi:hypothetical protein